MLLLCMSNVFDHSNEENRSVGVISCYAYFHARAVFDFCGALLLILFRWCSWLLICCTKARLHVYLYAICLYALHKPQGPERQEGTKKVTWPFATHYFHHVCGNTFKCLFQIHRMVSFVLAITPGNFNWLQCSSCIQTYVVMSTLLLLFFFYHIFSSHSSD